MLNMFVLIMRFIIQYYIMSAYTELWQSMVNDFSSLLRKSIRGRYDKETADHTVRLFSVTIAVNQTMNQMSFAFPARVFE